MAKTKCELCGTTERIKGEGFQDGTVKVFKPDGTYVLVHEICKNLAGGVYKRFRTSIGQYIPNQGSKQLMAFAKTAQRRAKLIQIYQARNKQVKKMVKQVVDIQEGY